MIDHNQFFGQASEPEELAAVDTVARRDRMLMVRM